MTITKTLAAQGLTLAVAESCSGGLIAHTITNIPGSSAFFLGGVVAYANTAKTALLGVPSALIEKHGAVSGPVARTMAAGVRKRFKAIFALSTTGIAGPAGGTAQKPVGLVFIALASDRKTIVKKCLFTGSRASIKAQACTTALNLLAEALK